MIYKIYSVYDSKAEAYMQPSFMSAKGAALRSFTDAVNDSSHIFGKHPEDYSLFELGSFDDCSASFNLYASPQSLGVGIEFIKEK